MTTTERAVRRPAARPPTLRDVLVKRPGAAFGRAFDDPAHGFLRPVDLDRARREHDGLVAALDGLGVRVHVLDARAGDDPDLVYVFDPLLVDRRAARSRSGRASRTGAGEPAILERGLDAARHPDGRPDRGARHGRGRRHGLAARRTCSSSGGRSGRTTPGRRQLAAIVGGDVRIVDVPYWKGPAELVHLMSVISPVADDLAVVFLPLLPAGLWALARASSASGWSRCPRRSTRRSAATSSRSGPGS